MVHIPIGHEHSITASGSVLKEVRCEECRCEYSYRMVRSGSGTATSWIFFDNQGVRAKERAAEKAKVDLERLLESDCDAVPCPECGHYQAHMYRAFRRGYRIWMLRYGMYTLLLFGACLVITWLCSLNEGFKDEPDLIRRFWIVTISIGGVGLALILAREVLSRLTDPNASDAETRRQLGQSRAVRKTDPA
jgi:hypothetical protein